MAAHTEDALRCSRVSEILDLSLAVTTPEAAGTECLVSGKDGQVFDLVAACATAIGAIVADEGAIAEQEEVSIRVEEGPAGMTPKAVEMPSVSS